MGDVINFNGVTRLDTNPDLVLESAIANLESCVIVGFNKEGGFYFASSLADSADVSRYTKESTRTQALTHRPCQPVLRKPPLIITM